MVYCIRKLNFKTHKRLKIKPLNPFLIPIPTFATGFSQSHLLHLFRTTVDVFAATMPKPRSLLFFRIPSYTIYKTISLLLMIKNVQLIWSSTVKKSDVVEFRKHCVSFLLFFLLINFPFRPLFISLSDPHSFELSFTFCFHCRN